MAASFKIGHNFDELVKAKAAVESKEKATEKLRQLCCVWAGHEAGAGAGSACMNERINSKMIVRKASEGN